MTAAALLAEELRRIGRQAGLDAVGICDATPFDDVRQILEERRRRGLAADMQFTYRNPARSTDPDRTLKGAQALFVGARRYLRAPGDTGRAGDTGGAGDASDAAGGPAAAVARYSWEDHYRPLRDALKQVAARLSQEGWKAMVVADDNALVDRAAAVRAGLGWYGKNTNVLIEGAGSWFVLGSVITDAPIAVDRPPAVADGCGTCHRCMDDCPTGAIVAPGELDARRCLAWLLQAPGTFPVEWRAALGDRIYGCDACQAGCPVNKLAQLRDPPPPAERSARPTVDAVAILRADDAALEQAIGRWYIPGREFRYVRRNALVVLGNVGDRTDPVVLDVLVGALGDPDPLIRAHAVWAAARLGRADLLEALAGEKDPQVLAELAAVGGRP